MRSKRHPPDLSQCVDCACLNLRKAARAMTQFYESVLHPTGLRGTQFSLLAAIEGAGSVTISRLAEWLIMDRTTFTRNLKPLVRNGWVRIAQGTDRRERVVTLTDRGREKLAEAWPLWRKAQERVVQQLGDRRWRRLLEDLSAAVDLTWGKDHDESSH